MILVRCRIEQALCIRISRINVEPDESSSIITEFQLMLAIDKKESNNNAIYISTLFFVISKFKTKHLISIFTKIKQLYLMVHAIL